MEYKIKDDISFNRYIEEQIKNEFKTIDGINSLWNRKISFKELTEVFVNFFDNKEIFSIGSGSGHFEYYFNEYISKITDDKFCKMSMTCVDPDPESYSKGEIKLYPLYKNIQELLKSRSEIVENCQIVIIWPSPTDTTYDIEAILYLKPKKIMILYEENGSSGGEDLHEFINDCEDNEEKYNFDIKYKANTFIKKTFISKMFNYDVDYYVLKGLTKMN